MTPPTGIALLILVAFVLPGFVTLPISERTHAVRDTSSAFERLLLAPYYSVLTYALLALIGWLAGYNRTKVKHLYKHEQSMCKILLFAFLAILLIPAFIATVSRLWLKAPMRRRRHHSSVPGPEGFDEPTRARLVGQQAGLPEVSFRPSPTVTAERQPTCPCEGLAGVVGECE